jgi:hypothetical protein
VVRDRGVLTRLVTSHNIGRPLALQRQQLRGFNQLQRNNLNNQNNLRNQNNNQNNQNNPNNPKGGGKNERFRNRLNRTDNGQNNNAQNNNAATKFQGNTVRPITSPKVVATPPRVRVPKIEFSIKP